VEAAVRDELEQLLTRELTIDNDGFLHFEACPERAASHGVREPSSAEGVF